MSQHHHQSSVEHQQQQEAPAPPTRRRVSAELKLYQAFIFSVPIFFTFVLLLLFYLLYLRRRRLHGLSSLQMRTSTLIHSNNHHFSSRTEMGLKKEVREMLPIIVFNESFSVRDTLCSVCLGEYQAEDRLQQIPACGHTFHMDCIDHWLSTHTTCPLCRLSLLPPTKPSSTPQPLEEETSHTPSVAEEDEHESSIQSCSHSTEDPPHTQHLPETSNRGGQINSETGSTAVEILGV